MARTPRAKTSRRGYDESRRDTGWGALWGLLTGGLFFVPLLGAAAGAGIGAILQATNC